MKPFPGHEGRLLTEEEVDESLERCVHAAKMFSECGADGADFKLCHGYLGSQLPRPSNSRTRTCGGLWEDRRQFAFDRYDRIQNAVPDENFLIGSKISA